MSDDRALEQRQPGSHRRDGTGNLQTPEREIRSLNPYRHVQPSPPSNADSDEYRQEMALFGQRFRPLKISDSNVRALELQRELYPDGVTGTGAPRLHASPAPRSQNMSSSRMIPSANPSNASIGAISTIAVPGSPRRVTKDPDQQISAARMPRRKPEAAASLTSPQQTTMSRRPMSPQESKKIALPAIDSQVSTEAPSGRSLISPVPADILLPASPTNAGEADWVKDLFSPSPPRPENKQLSMTREATEPFPFPGSSGGRVVPLIEVLRNHAAQHGQSLRAFATASPGIPPPSRKQTPAATPAERPIHPGLVTPPTRPTPSPSAPGPSRDRRVLEVTERAARTPAAGRSRADAREAIVPQTAPAALSHLNARKSEVVQQGILRLRQQIRQRGSPASTGPIRSGSASRTRRVSPVFISPSSRSFVPAGPRFDTSAMARPITSDISPAVIDQNPFSGPQLPEPSVNEPAKLAEIPRTGKITSPSLQSPSPHVLPQEIYGEQTPLSIFKTGRTLQDTLKRASESTPQGMWSPGTPMESRAMASARKIPSEFDEGDMSMGDASEGLKKDPEMTQMTSAYTGLQKISYNENATLEFQSAADVDKNVIGQPDALKEKSGKVKGSLSGEVQHEKGSCNRGDGKHSHKEWVEKRREKTANENLYISYILSPTKASSFPDPASNISEMQGQEPATYSFQAGQLTLEPPTGCTIREKVVVTHYGIPPTTTIDEVLTSAEAIRDVSKRIESVLKDYRSSLKIDAKELKRSNKEVQKERATIEATEDELLPAEEDQAILKEKLLKSQSRYGEHIQLLFDDLSKLEYDYRRNLERFNRQSDDPILDPVAGIPEDPAERTEEEEITYRGRLFTLAKLENLGYKGGPVGPFLQRLDPEEWKEEMREVILMSDPSILQTIQELAEEYEGGSIPDIDFVGIDLMDLETLPWGHFKLTGQSDTDSQRGKENTGPSHDIGSPIIPSETSDESEELERSYLSDPGITPALKSRLQQVREYDRL
ncbi:hypothetical protein ABW21_db0205479 [Orbilia brochopaga]|nr:hypothetical protein ABW21_db0205479 [Drechslerella brochopaga]